MRAIFKTLHWVTGLLLAVSTFFQAFALLGGVVFNEYNNFLTAIPWLVPVWAGMLIWLIVAFILEVKCGDKFPWPPILLAVSVIGTVAAFIVALTLRDALPDALNTAGEVQGITTWRLIYRHMTSVAVGALLAVCATLHWIVYGIQRRREAWDRANSPESTIGLDTYADEIPRRTKRRMRKK